ncbi:ANK1 [Symbiodinium microadriaticum]|nr:ANK1 [Symbiodinium microadriaticum]
MNAGDVVYVQYHADPGVFHTRLLADQVDGAEWMIITPDRDIYPELLDATNADFSRMYHAADGNMVISFELEGRRPPSRGPVVVFLRLVNRREHRQLPQTPTQPRRPLLPCNRARMTTWVAIEDGGAYKRGDVIAVDPGPLPPGHVILGTRAIVPAGADFITAKKVLPDQVPMLRFDDIRVLPVQFDAQGVRRREFNSAAALLHETVPQGGGLQLQGPASLLNVVKMMRDQNFTPATFHEYWIRSSELAKGDRSVYEHECLSRILESMLTVDQLNAPCLQSAELLVRRMQVIREAHRISPSAPDYSAADLFMGWKYRKSGQGVDAGLAAHVATELKNEAAISKEAPETVFQPPVVRMVRRMLGPLIQATRTLLQSSLSYSEVGSSPPPLRQLVDDFGRDILEDPVGNMMISADEWGAKIESGSVVQPYMDTILKNDPGKYVQFIHKLYLGGMLSFTDRPQDLITPFFVAKKSGKLRLVLDCRGVNQRFKQPPSMMMAAGASWSQVEVPDNETLYVAQSDITDYFYSLRLPDELQSYFCLPAIPHEALDVWRVPDSDRPPLHREGLVFPCFKVVPMGWSWAMYWAQRVHQLQALIGAGLSQERLLVSGKPAPSLEGGTPLVIAYADNLNVAGTCPERVQAAKDGAVAHLRSLGFGVHEELDACSSAASLGFMVDGVRGLVKPVPEKVGRVIAAFTWLSRRPRVNGRSVEKLLGHAVHFMLLRRELLSCMRSLYDYVQATYRARRRLWKSAAREAGWVASLLKICHADLRRRWDDQVTSSDASLSGMAVSCRLADREQVARLSRQQEQWRFKTRDFSAPRERALGQDASFPPHDPFSDPDTVKPKAVLPEDPFTINADFDEIPASFMECDDWHDLFAVRFHHPEPITVLESRGDGNQNEKGSKRSRKRTLPSNPEQKFANMEMPCLRAASSATNTSLMERRASVRRSLQGGSKPERATKRKRLMEANQHPRFPGQTFLEQAAISGQVAMDYVNRVEQFTQAAGIHDIQELTMPKLDEYLSTFLNSMFSAGADISEGNKTFAAVLDVRPGSSQAEQLPRSRRCLKGWANLDPGATRPPMPFQLIALIAVTMIQADMTQAALLVLIMFSAYLRPGEALSLFANDVVFPTKTVRSFAINLHPQDRMESSKTGLSDESVLIDSTVLPQLGPMLGRLARRRRGATLFDIDYATLLTAWHQALLHIGLAKNFAVLYQLRHSGPSHDRLHQLRTALEIKMRGRWASDSSVKRYEAHSRLSLEFQRLPDNIQRASLEAEKRLPSLMAKCNFMTLRAQPYPAALCSAIAAALQSAVPAAKDPAFVKALVGGNSAFLRLAAMLEDPDLAPLILGLLCVAKPPAAKMGQISGNLASLVSNKGGVHSEQTKARAAELLLQIQGSSSTSEVSGGEVSSTASTRASINDLLERCEGIAAHESSAKNMLRVRLMSSGLLVLTLSAEEFDDLTEKDGSSVKTLKLHLSSLTGQPRFRQRLLQGGSILQEDAQLSLPTDLSLVLLTFAVPEADCLRKLSEAISNDDEKGVESFLQKPCDPNCAVMDVACLSLAAYHGSLKSAKLLVEARANVAGGENGGISPLHATCHRGHSDFARWLLESKADVAGTFSDGRLTTTALHLACARGHLELLEVLVDGGADVNQLPPGQGSLRPMMIACAGGQLEAARYLLKYRADIDCTSVDGVTPLLCACERNEVSVVELLVEAGADKEKATISDLSPLVVATILGHTEVVRCLVRAGADIARRWRGQDGMSPLHVACSSGHLEVARVLVQGRADLTTKASGSTPIQLAEAYGKQDIAALLNEALTDHREPKRRRRMKGDSAPQKESLENALRAQLEEGIAKGLKDLAPHGQSVREVGQLSQVRLKAQCGEAFPGRQASIAGARKGRREPWEDRDGSSWDE